MSEKFLDAAACKMIEKYDFMPVADDNGEIYSAPGIRVLEGSGRGTSMLVELVNTDVLAAEDIESRLIRNSEMLKNIQGSGTFLFCTVFVTEQGLSQEKLQVISSERFNRVEGRAQFSCLSVDLSRKELLKHNELPRYASRLEKAVKDTLSVGIGDYENVQDIKTLAERKRKEYTIELTSRLPILTYTLIAINIAVWAAIKFLSVTKGVSYDDLLGVYGAKENLKIMLGEYWRFITPIFLHGSEVHLLINCFSLYQVGVLVEKIYGNKKFAFIYFTAGIIGNIASFMFSVNPAVGASGSIFGLLGALLYFGIEYPAQFRRYFGADVLITVFINISYGFSHAGIDNFAHMGGLLGGFLAAGIVKLKGVVNKLLRRPIFIAATVFVLGISLLYGFNCNQNVVLLKVEAMDKLSNAGNWTAAEKVGKEILAKNPKDKSSKLKTLWVMIVAEETKGNYEQAFEYARQLKQVDEARGSYMTAFLYFDTKQYDLARQELTRAKSLNAGLTEAVDSLLAEIDKVSK